LALVDVAVVNDAKISEASELLPLTTEDRQRLGLATGFWLVGDEQKVNDALGVLGTTDGTNWKTIGIGSVAESMKEEDAEALVGIDGGVRVIGSHFVSRGDGFQDRRHFTTDVTWDRGAEWDTAKSGLSQPTWNNTRDAYAWHRQINDAFVLFDLKLIERGPAERAMIAEEAEKSEVHPDDRLINIEGAAYMDNGDEPDLLLLGLRYPTTRRGHPIVVALKTGTPSSMKTPVVVWATAVEGIGSKRRPAGIRAMTRVGNQLHAIVGNLDMEEGPILGDHPEANAAKSKHVVISIVQEPFRGLWAKALRNVPSNTEGLAAAPDGAWFYLLDEKIPSDGSAQRPWLKYGGKFDVPQHP